MTTVKGNLALEELAMELDSEFGSVAGKLGTLNDVRKILGQLRIAMDETAAENVHFVFDNFHTKVRLIDDLVYYTMESLNGEFKNAEETQDLMFNKIVKGL